jgi:hypothetical protein
VTLFAQIAADVLGIRYVQFAEHGDFVGGQVGALQGQAGMSWNPSEAVSLRLSIGGRGNLALGALGDDAGFAMIHEIDVFARIQAMLGSGQFRWAVGVEGGYHQLGVSEFEHDDAAASEAHDHGSHGHPYVMVTLGGSF